MKGDIQPENAGVESDSNRSDWPPLNNRAPHLPRPSLSRLGDGGPPDCFVPSGGQHSFLVPASSFPRIVHNHVSDERFGRAGGIL
jgi:hypothetical protein